MKSMKQTIPVPSLRIDSASTKVEKRSLRNEAEAQFGTGKRIYRANDIRARLPETARCWTAMCYFVKNLAKFMRELCLVLIEIYVQIRHLGAEYVNPSTKFRETSWEEYPFPLCGTQTF